MTGSTNYPDNVWLAHGELTNDGTINVIGTFFDDSVALDGTGTINLNETPNYLGLSPTRSLFEFTGESSEVTSGQNFVFHGGHLILGLALENQDTASFLADFSGTLSNFGHDASDLIQLNGLASVTSSTYANGILTVKGLGTTGLADTDTLHFANLAGLGTFTFNSSGGNTDIGWRTLIVLHPV